jgi:hypothetical protein
MELASLIKVAELSMKLGLMNNLKIIIELGSLMINVKMVLIRLVIRTLA